MRKGKEMEVVIDKVRFPNMGIVDIDGKEVRIKGGLKGQKVHVRVSKKRREYMEAKILEVLEESPMANYTPCDHFGICGGCTYQNIKYEDELNYKLEQVENLFEKSGLDLKIKGITGSPEFTGYRNKMEFSFGDEYKGGPLSLGMHRKNRFYEIETVSDCNITSSDFIKIMEASLEFSRERDYPFYNRKSHQGLLRNLVVRKSFSKSSILVNLVTSSQMDFELEAYKKMLLELDLDGEITGIIHTINDNVADVVKADTMELIYGVDYIIEEICGLKFKISPFSFFQTNTQAAEVLYEKTRNLIGDIKDLTVFDLYSGTGTIAQIMAPVCKEVVAIELIPEAVEMARENAKLNGIDNIEFICGDMFKVIDQIDKKPDLIVIDPPRPGLENALEKIISFNPKKFIYVSCNPTTFVKDLTAFHEAGYSIGEVELVDQFPRTPHVECMVLMEKE